MMVSVIFTHAFRGRLDGDILGAHTNVEWADHLRAVPWLKEACIPGRTVAASKPRETSKIACSQIIDNRLIRDTLSTI